MKITSILINLFLIVVFNCEKNPSNNDNESDGGGTTFPQEEIDYSICENCIWLQNTCDGKWALGYNIEQSAIGGFQFTIENATILNIDSGDAVLEAGFSISASSSTILGFSIGGNAIPSGSGELMIIELQGIPSALTNIVFSNAEANSMNIYFLGIINCYDSSLTTTGYTQLTIFDNSINSLEIGDEIGIFDSAAILNSEDCSNQIGELLVGSGVWEAQQLNIVSVGSVDLCSLNGFQLSGYVVGNPLVIKVYRPSSGLVYLTELSWETGLGLFGEVIQSVNNINLIDSSLSRELF